MRPTPDVWSPVDTIVRETRTPEFPAARPDAVQLVQRSSACRFQIFNSLKNRPITVFPCKVGFSQSNLHRISGLLDVCLSGRRRSTSSVETLGARRRYRSLGLIYVHSRRG